jgi:hypothetical protein
MLKNLNLSTKITIQKNKNIKKNKKQKFYKIKLVLKYKSFIRQT